MSPTTSLLSPIFISPTASTYTYQPPISSPLPSEIQAFHSSLPSFSATPLIPLPNSILSPTSDSHTITPTSLRLFLKLESPRLTLPSFKVLGASYATFRTLCYLFSLPPSITLTPIPSLAKKAQEKRVVLFAATDGNHGRAVAWMARLLGVKCRVFVPWFSDDGVVGRIEGEGREGNVKVERVEGDYDDAVARAAEECRIMNGGGKVGKGGKGNTAGGLGLGVHIQDNAFEGYTTIPEYIVDGYSTMLHEIEEQLADQGLRADVIVSPVGVGSLASAVVKYAKSEVLKNMEMDGAWQKEGRVSSVEMSAGGARMKVLTVEAQAAPALNTNLHHFHSSSSSNPSSTPTAYPFSVPTSKTTMDGLCCPTPCPTAWPIVSRGVDVSVTISERASHDAVLALKGEGVNAGPCGAAGLAGLKRVWEEKPEALDLVLGEGEKREKVVVLLCTEGTREYDVPE